MTIGGFGIEGYKADPEYGDPDAIWTILEKSEDPYVRGMIPPEENKVALRAAFSSVWSQDGAQAAVKSAMESGIPVQVWAGTDDISHQPKQQPESLGVLFMRLKAITKAHA